MQENLDFGEPKETSEIEQTVQSIALTSFLAPAVFPRVSSALSVMNILQENKGLRDKNLVSGNEKASLRFKSTFLIEKQAPDIDSPYGGYFVSLSVPAPPRGLISAVPKLTLRYNAASNLKGDICVSRAVEMKIFVNDSISGGFDPASQSSVQDIVNYCTKLHQQHRIIAKTGWLLKKLESITALNARNEVTIASIESHATSPEGFLSNFICQVISESKEESSLSSDISRPLFLCAVHKGHLQAGVDVAELFSNGLKRTLRQPESECATCGVLKLKLPQRYCFSSQFVPPPDPRDPIVSFLGTGCATPSKYRSNSAILVQCTEGLLDPKSNNFIQHSWAMLLDAGESVCCQLHQLCSSDLQKYNDILLSIRIIWISHHHADHQTGLISLLQEIYRVHAAPALTSESSYQNRWTGDLYSFMNPSIISKKNESCRVVVIAPENVLRYAEYISCASGLDDVVQFVDINRTKYAGIDSTWAWAAGPLIPKCGKGFISSVPVEHCRNAFGICFTLWRPGTFELLSTVQTAIHNSYEVKIVFSGDCRPSISLVEVGQGCDLLIHEATFDDSMKEDALCKRHCTSSEALQVADAMQARHVVLTHFSQRYPRIMTSTGSEQYTNAVDFLRFAVPSQAVTLPALMNAVAEILGSETDE
jgi:ribonuclease BN (tRNA processing enzyme)